MSKNYWETVSIGCKSEYKVQPSPRWFSLLLFWEKNLAMISVAGFWETIFSMKWFIKTFRKQNRRKGGCVFAFGFLDPERYGVVEFDENYKSCFY